MRNYKVVFQEKQRAEHYLTFLVEGDTEFEAVLEGYRQLSRIDNRDNFFLPIVSEEE